MTPPTPLVHSDGALSIHRTRSVEIVVEVASTSRSRRSRLRAAFRDARLRAEADGRQLTFGADTAAFVEVMREVIFRANLRSRRPSLIGYVVRRWLVRSPVLPVRLALHDR